jgi:hypothetical protein
MRTAFEASWTSGVGRGGRARYRSSGGASWDAWGGPLVDSSQPALGHRPAPRGTAESSDRLRLGGRVRVGRDDGLRSGPGSSLRASVPRGAWSGNHPTAGLREDGEKKAAPGVVDTEARPQRGARSSRVLPGERWPLGPRALHARPETSQDGRTESSHGRVDSRTAKGGTRNPMAGVLRRNADELRVIRSRTPRSRPNPGHRSTGRIIPIHHRRGTRGGKNVHFWCVLPPVPPSIGT